MKRTTFTVLGLVALAFTACNFSTNEKAQVPQEEVAITIPVETQTTSEFEAKALEECIAIAQAMDEIKLMEAQAEQRLNDSLVQAEEELKIALAKSIEAEKKRARTPEVLAQEAKKAELWFQENYASVMEKYDSDYKGLKIKFATNGAMYDVQKLVDGAWKKDEKLLQILEKVQVNNDLDLGNAVSIIVSQV
ncbi:hypothetical protein [Kordia jejudonensis]|uniref:hypothetical protein n=1 Tax=Kordia jejudonensis TaxID=1348245 RepID=UPI00062991D4|nr:hypothetical protein [Kordia jejudonensis]